METTTTGRPPTPALASADWTALGTRVRLVVTAASSLDQARDLLVEELAAIDDACSRFRPDAEIVALDRAQGEPTRVSPLLAEAVGVALRAAQATDGDVDPTMGEALAAAGYDRDFALVAPDGPAVTVVRRPAPGWTRVLLEQRPDGHVLTVPAGVQLDLGATAKALAADRAAARITSALGCGVLVSLGGDVAVAGPAPQGGWAVRVQDVTGHPDDAPDGPSAVVTLTSGGLATSSTAARRWLRGGRLLHHILDPRDGLPVASPWRTVTVAAGTCVDANTASTAAVVRGKGSPAWLTSLGLPARLVDTEGHVTTVAGWPTEGAR